MSCMDNKDGSCSVEYIPYEPGTYNLNVTYGGHQVPGKEAVIKTAGTALCPTVSYTAVCLFVQHPGSPFKVPVHDVTDASKVQCSGPGLSPGMVRANIPQSFQVDTSKAGVAPLQVKVQGPKGECPPAWQPVARRGVVFAVTEGRTGRRSTPSAGSCSWGALG